VNKTAVHLSSKPQNQLCVYICKVWAKMKLDNSNSTSYKIQSFIPILKYSIKTKFVRKRNY